MATFGNPNKRMPPRSLFSDGLVSRPDQKRIMWAVGAFAVYALAYLPLRTQAGMAAGLLAVIPVILTGLAFGWRGGLLAGLLITPLHTILMNAAGHPGWDVVLRETNGLGPLVTIILGSATGYGSDLFQELQYQIAERRQAEQALRASEFRLNEAQRIAQIGNWTLDLETTTLTWSDEIYRIFEIDPQRFSASAEAFLRAIHPDDRGAVNQAYNDSVHNKTPYSIVHRLQMVDGRVKYVHERCETYYDPQGRPLYSIGTVQDITERKRAEEALREAKSFLRESEARYRALFEQSHDAVFILNMSGQHMEANRRAAEMFGYSVEEIQTLAVKDLSAELPESEKILQRLIAGEQVPTYERLFRKKNGEIFPVEINAELVRDDSGHPLHIQSVVRDITQRKQMEESLRKLSRAVEQTNVSIVITDTTGKIEYVNPFFSGLTGYTFEEALGNNPRILKSGLTPKTTHADMWKTITAGREWQGEFCNRKKNGELYWESASVSPVSDPSGSITHFVGVKTDITERRRAEEEREQLVAELSAKNGELERFSYTVSHDLKTPLVTISGFLSFLEQDAASGNMERVKKDMQRIHEAVQKMQRLLSELLELSRIGRMMNAPESIPFSDLVKEALDLVHGRLEAGGVSVRAYPNLPVIYGDRPRLLEVLQNLIDNAAKYMGNQPYPQIEIGLYGQEEGKPIFFVRDNGLGIAPEHHERIFGLFNKLEANSEGTGVGLAIVRRIIDVHGGRIWVESEAGEGSMFCFTLPVESMPSNPPPASG